MTRADAIGWPYSATNGFSVPAPSCGKDGVSGASYEVTPITMELGYRGIFITPGKAKARHTCPECSRTRRKASDRCLRVSIISPTVARLNCKHCPYRDEVRA